MGLIQTFDGGNTAAYQCFWRLLLIQSFSYEKKKFILTMKRKGYKMNTKQKQNKNVRI